MAKNLFTKNAINKRENIRKWVKALRSGKYQQAKERLHDGTGYCCLGVACVVNGFRPKVGLMGYTEFCGSSQVLKGRAKAAVGLADPEGLHGEDKIELTTLNDEGASFKEIATIINKEFKRQFGELP